MQEAQRSGQSLPAATKASERSPKCVLCRSNDTRLFRMGVRGDPLYPVHRCNHCRLVFLATPEEDLRSYYRDQYRQQYDFAPGVPNGPEARFQFQVQFCQQSIKSFRELVPEGASVLEVGCGAGGFLSRLQHAERCPFHLRRPCTCTHDSYDLYGSEWNPEDAAYVRDVGEIPCEEGEIKDIYPGRTFTAIVAIQVLEHQADPVEFIRQCRDRLIGGGYLYLEVPNLRDAMLSFYDKKEYADFWFRKPHLTYWTGETLAALVSTMGFEAKMGLMQRYGLANHINWIMNGTPMDDPYQARRFFRPVDADHPVGPVLNRLWSRLDQDYRLQMENLFGADTISCSGRRQEI